MEITLRKSEPVVTFHMDKTEPGAFNLPIFRMFADPFNTAGLVIDRRCTWASALRSGTSSSTRG